jgi:MFS family permease
VYVIGPELQLSLIVCKAGLAGSAPIACGGGVIADLFVERERASAMALYSLGPLLGAFHNVQI